jgi:hypothetical protein
MTMSRIILRHYKRGLDAPNSGATSSTKAYIREFIPGFDGDYAVKRARPPYEDHACQITVRWRGYEERVLVQDYELWDAYQVWEARPFNERTLLPPLIPTAILNRLLLIA